MRRTLVVIEPVKYLLEGEEGLVEAPHDLGLRGVQAGAFGRVQGSLQLLPRPGRARQGFWRLTRLLRMERACLQEGGASRRTWLEGRKDARASITERIDLFALSEDKTEWRQGEHSISATYQIARGRKGTTEPTGRRRGKGKRQGRAGEGRERQSECAVRCVP